MAVEEFVQKTQDLLSKERDAEIEETSCLVEKLSAKELERRGVCLLKLQLKSRRAGLYGRLIGVFEPQVKHGGKNVKPELPSHNLTPGDIVGVAFMKSESTEKPLATGIVSQVTTSNISIALDESQDIFSLDDDEIFKLTKLANDVTYRRLKTTLQDLANYRGPSQRLIDVLFCLEEISRPIGEFPITFVNETLDESQREAVKFALTQKEIAIIHGPPGTGKTTTVVELIIQAVRQGLKVLATAPSNIAVDNLVEKLASHKQKIVRIGHPARLLTHLQKYSLDALVASSEQTGIVQDVRSDLQKAIAKLKKARGHGEKQALRAEMKQLRREAAQREEAATRDILSRADVVLVTLTSATNDGPLKLLQIDHFDLVVIDECSQALEVACWIGLLRAPRCVLAGDHLQLPPTILSKEAASSGLEITLMERLLKTLAEEKEKDIMRMLTTQYRMHEDIMTWASQQLYQGKLVAHESVASHLLRDLNGVTDCEETGATLLLVDTAGCDLLELDLPEDISKGNEGEADIVTAHVEDLIKYGVKPADIAIITPYNLQVELLRVRLCTQYPDLEVKSVDGFQGREKEAVVISMVRSNPVGEVGFLAEKRRINVAVTRARRHLTVVCDSETVSRDPFIKSLVDYLMEKGEVLSAHQFIQEGKVSQTSIRPAKLTDLLESKKGGNLKQAGTSKQDKPRGKPLPSKEEKLKLYEKELQLFLSDPAQTFLNYPASLNSHDRMVIHEVAEKLGLTHTSTGEGRERHIQVSKVKLETKESPTAAHSEREPSVTSRTDNFKAGEIGQERPVDGVNDCLAPCSPISDAIEDKADSQDNAQLAESTTLQNDNVLCVQDINCDKSQPIENGDEGRDTASCESTKETTQKKRRNKQHDMAKSVDTDDTMSQSMSLCQHCQKQILNDNMTLHVIHCAKQIRQDEVGRGGGGGVESPQDVKLKTKPLKEKQKPPKSHVQRASDILSKVDNDDFEGLIASITELDSKCAYRKCKILTNTLGRNCEYCTRRFCLTHLMPEVHGCGDVAKDAARRIISREGVLHSGSGVPSKKPNQARRAQLENKLEKKLGELAGKRARNVEKKKS